MRYYPVMLDLRGRKVLMIGCGKVGFRKLTGLFATGAQITVIDPNVGDASELSEQVSMHHRQRRAYKEEKDAFRERLTIYREAYELRLHKQILLASDLVFLCTDDLSLHGEVTEVTRQAGIWTLRCDRGDLSDFINPIVTEKEELMIAVSTSGSSPSFARQIKEKLEEWIRTIDTAALRTLKEKRRKP